MKPPQKSQKYRAIGTMKSSKVMVGIWVAQGRSVLTLNPIMWLSRAEG